MKKQKVKTVSSGQDIFRRVKELKPEAESIIKEKRFKDADALISELLKIDDQHVASNRLLAKALVDVAGILLPTGEYEQLEKLFRKAITGLQKNQEAKAGDVIVAMHNLAVLFDQSGASHSRDEIFSFFVKFAKSLSDTPDAETANIFIRVGSIHEKAGLYEPASILYHQVIRYLIDHASELPQDLLPDMLVKHGNMLAANSQYNEAQEVLECLAEQDYNRRSMLLSRMGSFALAKGDQEIAELWLKQAIQLAERVENRDAASLSAACRNLASLYLQTKKLDQINDAEELINRALAVDADAGLQETAKYAGGLGQLALIAEKKREFDKAEQLYEECFRIYENAADTNSSEFADFLTDAGFLYLGQQRPIDATDVFSRAQDLRQSTLDEPAKKIANAISNHALAKFKAGDYVKAIRLYIEAIECRHKMEGRGVRLDY